MKPILKIARKETKPFKVPVIEFLLEENNNGNIDLIAIEGGESEVLFSIVANKDSEKYRTYEKHHIYLSRRLYLDLGLRLGAETTLESDVAKASRQIMNRLDDMYGYTMIDELSKLGKEDES